MKYLIGLFLFLSGCAPVLLGAGAGMGVAGYKYISGELTVDYIARYETVWNATMGALTSLGIKVEEFKKDALSGKIKAKKSDGKAVTIKLKNKPSKIVEVKIKVGIFGDKDASFVIKKAIDTKLGIRGGY